MTAPQGDAESRLTWYRESLKHSLSARFVLRFHVALIVGFAACTAWLFDYLLLKAGLVMMLRYPIVIGVGYTAFVGGVWAWLEYSGIRQYLTEARAAELVDAKEPQRRAREPINLDLLNWAPIDGEGCLIVIGVAAAGAAIFWALGYFAIHLFTEVVLEFILAAGLLRGLRKAESSGWIDGVWRAIRAPLVAITILAIGFASWAHMAHPGAMTFAEVVRGK